jgi:hypothetical protein
LLQLEILEKNFDKFFEQYRTAILKPATTDLLLYNPSVHRHLEADGQGVGDEEDYKVEDEDSDIAEDDAVRLREDADAETLLGNSRDQTVRRR